MKKTALTLVLAAALSGCASNPPPDNNADLLQRIARAERAAAEAQQAAARAQARADEALAQAQASSQQVDEKVDRAFRKTQQK